MCLGYRQYTYQIEDQEQYLDLLMSERPAFAEFIRVCKSDSCRLDVDMIAFVRHANLMIPARA